MDSLNQLVTVVGQHQSVSKIVCGDYSVTVNSKLDVEQYPLAQQEDIFSSLAGGKKFTLILVACLQPAVLIVESQKYVLTEASIATKDSL